MVRQAKKEIKLPLLEEEIRKKWREERIYERSEKKRSRGKKFYFLDGPPYASGAIHLGTAWNKIIKDAVLRYLTLKGYNVKKQPGWDCHGLPIEVKVESKLGIKSKKEIERLGVEKFVQACESWANEHIIIMTQQFSSLGIFMGWNKPYKTMNDAYIEAAWWTLKKAHEKNLLVEDLRVVTFCPRCETALAEAEVEYEEREDPSIYVKFPVKGEGREGEFLLVWTTTPWTLIGNLAVMVNPEYEYAKAKTKEGMLIVAKELLNILKDKLNLDYEVVETLKGSELEFLKYSAPLEGLIDLKFKNKENAYFVILSKNVVLTEGTGLVHCAPGHGEEDFEAGKKYGIEPLCPVDEQGRFKEEAGVYKGLKAKKDDAKIVADLKARNLLLKEEKIVHRYGHCWRCSTPILYRATTQWFLKITELKEKMLSEIEKAKWVPEWAGSARFKDWIEGARDWAISRQRYWGIPLPVWKCKCGSIEVIGSKKELEKRSGKKVEELHKPYVDEAEIRCSSCGEKVKRVSDVLDVWFDSGVATWASLADGKKKIEELDNVADLIIEGHDQTRGWFYSLLGCGLISFGRIPYRKVLMHGFTLDEKGEKMSKSLGNVITPEEVVSKYGADVLRFYVLWANKPWEDLKFSWKEIEVISRMFNILWNSHVFATTYMSLDKFTIEKYKDAAKYYGEEERWIVSRLNSVIKEVSLSFETLELYRGARALHDFIVEDLSRWYIPLIRSKTWIESESNEKLASYHALYRVLHSLSIILTPFSPHIAEEIFSNLTEKPSSPMLESWIEADENEIDAQLEQDMKTARRLVEEALMLREKASMKRRWPIQRVVFKTEEKYANAVKKLSKIIKTTINAKELEVASREQSIAGDFISSSFELGELFLDKRESEELKAEGFAREIVRRIQSMRKELNLEVEAFINTNIEVKNEKVKEYIELQRNYIVRETRTKELSINTKPYSFAKKWKIKEEELYISITQL